LLANNKYTQVCVFYNVRKLKKDDVICLTAVERIRDQYQAGPNEAEIALYYTEIFDIILCDQEGSLGFFRRSG